MNPDVTENGRRLEQQVAEIRQLLAGVQADLDKLNASGAAADPQAVAAATAAAIGALAQRRVVLDETVEALRQGQGELERQLEANVAELASREAALETSQAQLRALTRRLVQVQEDERRSLARDLHDTSGQAMTILGLGLAVLSREAGCSEKTLTRIADLRRMAETVGEDLHRLSVNLRPSSLDRYGLVPALDEFVHSMRKQAGIEVEFAVEGLEERLPEDTETALYRIVQEACTNIVRYSGATRAVVSLRRDGGDVQVRVEDNGRGFDVDEAVNRGRLGLVGMRERAEMLAGQFSVDSRPGHGTVVDVRVPSNGPAPVTASNGGSARQLTAQIDTGVDQSGAAELARAKALSDVLVEIAAGMSMRASAEELLRFVLARSAEAIACDYAITALREGDHWVISQGYRIPEFAVGRRLTDEDLPGPLQIERTGQMFVVNDMRKEGSEARFVREAGALSGAGVPLVAGGKFLGVLAYAHNSAPIHIAPSEIAFLERLSTLVSLALENIQLRELERQQRELLEAVFESAPIGVAVMSGRDLQYKMANAAYRAVTPHPEVDPAGRCYAEIWPPAEGFDRGEPWLAGVMETGKPLDVEHYRRVFPDGSEHYFAFHVRRLSWAGEPAALVVLADTTATEQAAAQARQSALELDTILSAISDGLVVYGSSGQILRMNGTAQAILGYSRGEADAPFEQRARYLELKKPDGQPYPFAELPAVRALRGETVRGAIMALEQAGSTTWVSASAAPLYAPGGALRGAVSTFADITALRTANRNLQVLSEELGVANEQLRAQAEELAQVNTRLAEERDRLNVLLASIPDEVWFCGAAGNVTAANPAAVRGVGLPATGEPFQPFPDWTALEMLNPDGQPRPLEQAPLLRALRGEKVQRQEEIVRNLQTGEWRHREASGEAIRDSSGQITGAVLVVRDITEQTRAEQAQRSNQAIYRAIAQSFPNGAIYVFDHDLRYLVAEGEALSLFGQTREEMEGKTIWEALDAEAAAVVEPRYRRALAGESMHFETRHGPAYGNRVVSADYRPIRGEDGNVLAGLLVAQDVTHRVRLLVELEDRVAELTGILSALPSGLIVYDAEGHIVRMNDPAREMLGYDEEDWKRPVSERVVRVVQAFKPDGTPFAREDYAAMRVLRGEVVHNEDVFIHLPQRPEKDFWAILSACPIKGDDGRLSGAVITMTDTTELHRVRKQLERARAESEAILSSIPDGLIVNDMDGRVTRMNAVAEAMLQYTPEDRAMPLPERLPAKMQLLRYDGTPYSLKDYPPVRALRGEVVRSQEMIMRTPARPEADLRVLASAGPITLDDGERLGAVTILTNISDLHQVRTLSRRLVELQEHERSYVADQLYNQAAQVLAALKMQLWALERSQGRQASDAQLGEMKASLDVAIRALHDLASDLRPAGLDLASLADLLYGHVLQVARSNGIAIRFDPGDASTVRLAPDATTAVFRTVQEAIANVAQHARATEVSLVLRKNATSLTISLADNGVGFDAASASRTGVGLIAMRERLEPVGGRLTIHSEPAGTTVWIQVPL